MKERLFFCYGTLMKHQWNHSILDHPDVEFLGESETEPEFTMVSCGGFPAVLPEGNTSIKGEVFKVKNQEVVDRLNMLEGYREGSSNNHYDIMTIDTPYGVASMYIQTSNRRSRPIIESGSWRDFIKNQNNCLC